MVCAMRLHDEWPYLSFEAKNVRVEREVRVANVQIALDEDVCNECTAEICGETYNWR